MIDIEKLKQLRQTINRKGRKGHGGGSQKDITKQAECTDLVCRIMGWTRVVVRGPGLKAVIWAAGYGIGVNALRQRCLGSPGDPGPIRGLIKYSRASQWIATPKAVRMYNTPAHSLLWTQEHLDQLFSLEDGLVNIFNLEPEEVIEAVREYARNKYT